MFDNAHPRHHTSLPKAHLSDYHASYGVPTRQIALRISIVLGEDGGVMTAFENLVRFGLGGVQGSGNQMFSWIHIEDLYRTILLLQDEKRLKWRDQLFSPISRYKSSINVAFT